MIFVTGILKGVLWNSLVAYYTILAKLIVERDSLKI